VADPYFDLLGIPLGQRPPTHYQLLGLDPASATRETIWTAAERQLSRLRLTDEPDPSSDPWRDGCGYRDRHHGPDGWPDELAGIAAEILMARDALLDPGSRRQYDELLSRAPLNWWQPAQGQAAPPVAVAPSDTSAPSPPRHPQNAPTLAPPGAVGLAAPVWWAEPAPNSPNGAPALSSPSEGGAVAPAAELPPPVLPFERGGEESATSAPIDAAGQAAAPEPQPPVPPFVSGEEGAATTGWWAESAPVATATPAPPSPAPPSEPAAAVVSPPQHAEGTTAPTDAPVEAPPGPGSHPTAPAPAVAFATSWWSDEVKAAPAPPPAAAPVAPGGASWWADEVKQEQAATPAPAAAPPAVAAQWWADDVKPAPAPQTAPVPGWWKDSAPDPGTPTAERKMPAPIETMPPPVSPLPYQAAPVLPSPSWPGPARSVPPAPPPLPVSAMPPPLPVSAMPPPLPVSAMPPPLPVERAPLPLGPDDEDDFAPRRPYQQRGSSPLPWILMLLVVVCGGIGAAAWYVTKEKPEPSHTEVASNSAPEGKSTPSAPAKTEAPKKNVPPRKKIGPASPDEGPAPPDPAPPKPVEPAPPPPNTQDFTDPRDYRAHKAAAVRGIGIGVEGKAFVTTGDDMTAVLTTIADGERTVLQKLDAEGVGAVLFDNDQMAAVSYGYQTLVFDLVNNVKQRPIDLPDGRGGVAALCATPDGRLLLTGTTSGYVLMWAPSGGRLLHEFKDVSEKKLRALAVNADGTLAVAGVDDGMVAVCDLTARRVLKRWQAHKGAVTALAFAPDGKRFVSFGEETSGCVWEAATGAAVGKKLIGHKAPVLGAGWRRDGRQIVSAGVDKRVHLWAAATGEMDTWEATTAENVECLAVDPRDRFVLLGLANGFVRLVPLPAAPGPKE
jgi:hypothetical protein